MKNKKIEIIYKGQLVECLKNNNGNYQIVRLISTNPNMYLNKNYMPGTILEDRYIDKNCNNIYNINNFSSNKM